MDGAGGPPAGCDRVDDGLGTRHDVAAGEDPGVAGRERPRVGDDAGEGADLDAGALGQDRRIGLLADRDEDRRRRDRRPRCPGPAPRPRGRPGARPVGACSAIRTPVVVPSGATTSVTTVPIRKAMPSARAASTSSAWAGISANPRRYRTVTDLGAAAQGGPRGVHRRAAATDDDDRAGQPWLLAQVDLLEEDRGRDDAAGPVAGHAEPPALRRAGGEEDGLDSPAARGR